MAADVSFTVEAIDKASSQLRTIGTAITGFNQGLQLVQSTMRAVGRVYDDIIGKTVDYAMEVDRLSRMLGTTAEESSKMIQAADDMAISVDTLTFALKSAIVKGYEPTMEGLGKIADQYNSLGTQMDKTRYLAEIFGSRAGPQLAKLLEQGSAGIAAMGEEAEALGLVLSRADIQAAEDYRRAIDNLEDSFTGLKTTIGKQLVPVMADLAEVTNTTLLFYTDKGFKAAAKSAADYLSGVKSVEDAYFDLAHVAATMLNDMNVAWIDGDKLVDEYSKSITEASDEIVDFGSELANALQSAGGGEYKFEFITSYAEQYDDVYKEIKAAENELAALRAAGWSDTSQKVVDAQGKVDALKMKAQEFSNQMILSMAQMVLLADGIQPGDIKAYLDLAVELGSLSQEAADASMVAWNDTIGKVKSMLASIPTTITVHVVQEGSGGGAQMEAEPYASGGHIPRGGWGVVGDAPGGRWTPYTELVYAPQGATVIPAKKARQMASSGMPHMAEGGTIGGGMDLSPMTIAALANAIGYEIAMRAG